MGAYPTGGGFRSTKPRWCQVRVGQRARAGGIQPGDLLGGERPADRLQVLPKLLFVARTDNHARHRRSLQQPVERNLRHRFSGLARHRIERVHHVEQVGILDLRALVRSLVQPARRRQRRAAAELTGQPAPAERAPDHRAHALIERERHQLCLIVPPDQRIIGLMRDVAREVVAIRHRQRLHQMPAGEVGAADVADLAGPHEIVQRGEGLLDWGQGIEAVQLEEIDMIGLQPLKGGVARIDEMPAGGADIVRPRAGAERRLGRDQHAVAPSLDCLAQDLLGGAVGVDVGAVKHRQACIQADIDQAAGRRDIGVAPGTEEFAFAAECPGPKTQHGHAEAGSAKSPVFHVIAFLVQ